jgi:hypothetical protein
MRRVIDINPDFPPLAGILRRGTLQSRLPGGDWLDFVGGACHDVLPELFVLSILPGARGEFE